MQSQSSKLCPLRATIVQTKIFEQREKKVQISLKRVSTTQMPKTQQHEDCYPELEQNLLIKIQINDQVNLATPLETFGVQTNFIKLNDLEFLCRFCCALKNTQKNTLSFVYTQQCDQDKFQTKVFSFQYESEFTQMELYNGGSSGIYNNRTVFKQFQLIQTPMFAQTYQKQRLKNDTFIRKVKPIQCPIIGQGLCVQRISSNSQTHEQRKYVHKFKLIATNNSSNRFYFGWLNAKSKDIVAKADMKTKYQQQFEASSKSVMQFTTFNFQKKTNPNPKKSPYEQFDYESVDQRLRQNCFPNYYLLSMRINMTAQKTYLQWQVRCYKDQQTPSQSVILQKNVVLKVRTSDKDWGINGKNNHNNQYQYFQQHKGIKQQPGYPIYYPFFASQLKNNKVMLLNDDN